MLEVGGEQARKLFGRQVDHLKQQRLIRRETQALQVKRRSARLELQFGSWLRRRKRYQEAREHLRIAEELFHRLGATAWHQRAHAELRAAGETQRAEPHDDLTPQEHRIALLAAEGLSNRQIAERLALSPRTVGYHLYKIFPKLDITSRAQLASALQRASTRNRGSG